MAKRPPPPKKKPKSQRPTGTSTSAPRQSKSLAAPVRPNAPPPRRSGYFEAIALYERGMEALQRHDYPAAVQVLESVLQQCPEERELNERAQIYLNVCRQQSAPQTATPQTPEERLYASTLAINEGGYDKAISYLRLVRDEDPDNDHALYMLGVAHAQRGEHAEAVAHLERAIALNPANRGLARHDPDLEPLRNDKEFHSMVEPAAHSPVDRRPPLRTKSGR